MLSQQNNLESAAWAASGVSTIRMNRMPREVDGARAHLVGLLFHLHLHVTADAANDTDPYLQIRAIEELKLTDSIGVDIVRLKGHMIRTFLQLLTGRLNGGHADAANIVAGSGAQERDLRFFIPFAGAGGLVANGILGLRRWTDAIQPVDRFLSDNAMLQIQWGTATPYGAAHGTVTAATLTVTPLTIPLGELDQGIDFRINYQANADAQRFDLSLKAPKLLCACLCNPDNDHIDYTQLDLAHGLLVRADPIERCAAFNALCVVDRAENITLTAPEFIPVVFAVPGQSLTKLQGFGYPPVMRLETTNTHAAQQWMAYCEVYNRAQLVSNLKGAGLGDYTIVDQQSPKYSEKNFRRDTRKATMFNAMGPAKLRRSR